MDSHVCLRELGLSSVLDLTHDGRRWPHAAAGSIARHVAKCATHSRMTEFAVEATDGSGVSFFVVALLDASSVVVSVSSLR